MPKPSGPARKKTPGKSGAPKPSVSKPVSRPVSKPAPKPVKKAAAPAPKRPAATSAKAGTNNGRAKPPAPAPVAQKGKVVRKGITIVSQKPVRKPRIKPPAIPMPNLWAQLLKPGGPARKPLIPSGPNAPAPGSNRLGGPSGKPKQSPYNKRELAKFRTILLRKRAELAGDISTMETEALRGQSGSLSHLPQHMAEQGSDAYDQSLSLDLAAADRKLIKQIDDALARIENGTYGICELTGRPIKAERLEELPWARYSIEAARELERRSHPM